MFIGSCRQYYDDGNRTIISPLQFFTVLQEAAHILPSTFIKHIFILYNNITLVCWMSGSGTSLSCCICDRTCVIPVVFVTGLV